MDSIFGRLDDIKELLLILNKRLDTIEEKLNPEEKTRPNIQQAVEVQTAVKRLNQLLK